MSKEKQKILTEGTPNPNALKFVLEKTLIESGSVDFKDKESVKKSPLAKKLFEIDSVDEVLIGKDFITITKTNDVIWDNIYEKIISAINNHFESGEPIITDQEKKTTDSVSKDPVEKKIKEILDSQIRPAVAADGGDIIFESYDAGILRLHLQGACSTCPSAIMTLKVGVEQMLKRHIPEIKEVISI